ncbi:MAG: 30S ribosomal protein S3ae [archaeon]|nr:30S ribosomal protein S3ae [archaeon]
MSTKTKSKGGRRKKVVDNWKIKKWYDLYAPTSFKNEFIAKIPSGNPENLIGRVVEQRAYDFTKNFNHTHIKLFFKVTDVEGLRCETKFVGHELTRDYVRALIHRGSSRVDGIFNYKTADGFIYRVSAFCVTKRRAKGSQKNTIRKIIYEVLNEFAKSSKHGKFVRGMVYGKYAENITKLVRTIYPLKECQIRKCKLISSPEGIVDEEYDAETETFEEKEVQLKPHGKQIKAMQKARKVAQKQASSQEKRMGKTESAEGKEKETEKETEKSSEETKETKEKVKE